MSGWRGERRVNAWRAPGMDGRKSLDGSLRASHRNRSWTALPNKALMAHVPMTPDPHAALRDKVLKLVLEGAGESDPALRQSAASGKDVPWDFRELVERIHEHAYKVTDEDVAALQAKYGDDRMFEIIVSAALGASRKRLFAGLDALEDA